ncbi:UNVERIFIED_CONTAM: Ribonuclease HI [Sesamum angustifolium]|uniref:Ribonuclease HI n=1 Tax=Sesamum angustifolium TaxID=2727405 RepID=A0AAW2LGI7_9LAMI
MTTKCGWIFHNSRQWFRHSHYFTLWRRFGICYQFGFKASNDKAEYEALVIGMMMTHDVGAKHLVVYSDSQLIVKQVEGTYKAKEENMIHYLQQIAELKTGFKSFQLIHIPREENIKADCLSKLASTLENYKTRHITIQHLPKFRAPLNVQAISSIEVENPRDSMVGRRTPPPNRWDAAMLKSLATRFLLKGGVLYKKNPSHTLYSDVYLSHRDTRS